jgi:hypothetical protein
VILWMSLVDFAVGDLVACMSFVLWVCLRETAVPRFVHHMLLFYDGSESPKYNFKYHFNFHNCPIIVTL